MVQPTADSGLSCNTNSKSSETAGNSKFAAFLGSESDDFSGIKMICMLEMVFSGAFHIKPNRETHRRSQFLVLGLSTH